MRTGTEHRNSHPVPRAAGRQRRTDDSALTNPAALQLQTRACRHGHRHVVDDHADRPHHGAAARRLDHRQHLLAVDFLYQRARGSAGRDGHCVDLPATRNAHPQAADRLDRAGAVGHLGGLAADHARQGAGTRLVFQPGHHRAGRRGRGGFRAVPDLGNLRRASGSRPDPVQDSDLHHRHHPAGAGLRHVLRQPGAAAAVAAGVHRLHRHRRGRGAGLGGLVRADSLAHYRALSARARFALGHHVFLPGVRHRVLYALAVHHGRQLLGILHPHGDSGHRDGDFLHPAAGHHPRRIAVTPHRGGVGAIELRAHHRRFVRHLDLHHLVDRPRRSAP